MIIEARNLSKKVIFNNQEIIILDSINLKLEAASSLAVVGPSGSGKSTLLGILAGLDSPSSGEIYNHQKPLHLLSEEVRAEIRKESVAFVFQNFELLSGLNALENVMLPLELKNKANAKDVAINYLEKLVCKIVFCITHKTYLVENNNALQLLEPLLVRQKSYFVTSLLGIWIQIIVQ